MLHQTPAIGATMYEANGIDLPRSQYRELRDLVSLGSDEDRKAFSNKALHPYEDISARSSAASTLPISFSKPSVRRAIPPP